MSGVRHYDKNCDRKQKDNHKKHNQKDIKNDDQKNNDQSKKKADAVGDSRYREFYLKKHFKTLEESLNLFKDDELCYKPGKHNNKHCNT